MNSLLKAVLFPLLFALDMQVTLPGEEREHENDLVTFQFKSPSVVPAPVASSNPRVKTAYDTAYSALHGSSVPSSEVDGKRALSASSGSSVEQGPPAQVTILQMMQNDWQMQRARDLKKQKSKPKTA